MIRTLSILVLYLFITGSAGLYGQDAPQFDSEDPYPDSVVKPKILVLESEIVGISAIEAQTLSDYIRFEVVLTEWATTVSSEEIQNILSGTSCTTDSCIKVLSNAFDASHAIRWSLERNDEKYRLDFQYLNVVNDPVTIKRKKRNYRGDENGLLIAIQRSVWEVMSVTPPDGRFPDEESRLSAWIQPLKDKADQAGRALGKKINRVDRVYLVTGGALVLVGAGIAIFGPGRGPGGPVDNIGSPPDWPEP